ncbi:xylulokinase [Trinickia symbiotica]|nr:FGGY family carbohydrate kinase [Trinickia symbiotica]PPK43705.1 xylulokinase [Trinickia symbiotica]
MSATVTPAMDVLLCGIDLGSTNLKVILVDGQAQTLWTKAIPVPRVMQGFGPVTDAMVLVEKLEQLVIEGWQAVGTKVPLTAISVTGVGEDGLAVGRDLRPLDLAIPWFDRRAEQEARTLRELTGDDIRAGLPIDYSRTAAKWSWLRANRANAMREASFWIALTDYPTVWWGQTPFMSQTLAARTACYDVFSRTWISGLLEASGAPDLPKVVTAGTVIGTVATGCLLKSGAATQSTLLVAGGHDHPIAASAVRRLKQHAMIDSLGTANLVYDEVPALEPHGDPYVAFSVPALGTPGVACLGVFEFAASIEPFRASDSGASLRAFLASSRARGAPSALPDIREAIDRAIRRQTDIMGTADPQQLRATLEAACFYAKCMRQAIQKAGAAASPIYAVGGWARSDALLQLRASIFGESVFAVEEDELTALGVALVARDALGPSLICEPFSRKSRVVQPVPEWQDAYERLHAGATRFISESKGAPAE